MNTYFEVEYRGVQASVEAANGTNRWEIKLNDGSKDWISLAVGNYPTVSLDEARAAAVAMCKARRPSILAGFYRQRDVLAAKIRALEAD